MVTVMLAAAEGEPVELNSIGDVPELLKTSILDLAEGFIADLPVYLIALAVFFIGLVAVRYAIRGVNRGVDEATSILLSRSSQSLSLAWC